MKTFAKEYPMVAMELEEFRKIGNVREILRVWTTFLTNPKTQKELCGKKFVNGAKSFLL